MKGLYQHGSRAYVYCFQWTGDCAEGWSASAADLDKYEKKESISHLQSDNACLQFTDHRETKPQSALSAIGVGNCHDGVGSIVSTA